MKRFGASTDARCGCQRFARLAFLSASHLPHLRFRLETPHVLEGGPVPRLAGVVRPTTCESARSPTTSAGGHRRGDAGR